MKPDWDRLMDQQAGNANAIVADVDCTTAGGKPLCEEIGVKSYPTIKYGNPAEALSDYKGPRDFNSLNHFAGTLKKPCSVKLLSACDEESRKRIVEWQAMAPEDLDALIKEKEDQIAAAEAKFKQDVENLQNRFKELEEEKVNKIEAVKNSNLPLLRQVKAYLYPYQMSTLEKIYYTVWSPVENMLAQLGLLDSVENVANAITKAVSAGTASLGKAFGAEL